MPDGDVYLPLDLTPYRNTAAAILRENEHEPALGLQHFHGLPFRIGEGEEAFIGLREPVSSTSVSIPVQRNVYCVVFAHRLLGSRIAEGGPVGARCAEYV